MSEQNEHGYYFEQLEVGMSASYTKTITEADVVLFAGLSGDNNPVHINKEFAEKTMFKERIAHGSLTCSFISTVLGMKLPGPGAIFVAQEHKFKAPVKIGDTVQARVEVESLVEKRNFVVFKTQCFVGDKIVIDGKATVMVDSLSKI
ncbi:MAG: MaoC family dehydratase [Pseudomonadota bacterium]